jgi:hypothetical protein
MQERHTILAYKRSKKRYMWNTEAERRLAAAVSIAAMRRQYAVENKQLMLLSTTQKMSMTHLNLFIFSGDSSSFRINFSLCPLSLFFYSTYVPCALFRGTSISRGFLRTLTEFLPTGITRSCPINP